MLFFTQAGRGLALLGLSLAFGSCAVRSAGAAARVEKDVVYTPPSWPKPLLADVYQPRGRGPFPAVLLIHGGGWKTADGRWQMKSIARKLARHGYVVVNVSYRGTPEFQYPAPLEDLREALRWMRINAPARRIDPERIATFGYSAGGHLAALVALKDAPAEAQPKVIVAGGGPFDLTLYPGGDLVPALLGGTQSTVPERFRDASPVNHVRDDSPPIFLYHGSADKLVPPEHARRMQAEYQRHGVKNEIRWLPGRSHLTAFVFSGSAVDDAIRFLDRTLK